MLKPKNFNIILVLLFAITVQNGLAQNWDWVQTIGVDVNGSWGGHQSVNGLCNDLQGNTIATGRVKGYSRFGKDSNIITTTPIVGGNYGSQTDVFIVKYNKSGNIVWANQDGGFAPDWGRAITTDNTGNIYVAGDFIDSVTFDAIPLKAVDTIYRNIFLLKLDSNGNYIWGKSFGGQEGDARPYGITIDDAGNIYITGYITGIVNFDTISIGAAGKYEGFIAKFNPDGNTNWATWWGTLYPCQGNDIVYKDDAIYVAGYFHSAIWLGPVLHYGVNPGWPDCFFMKYDLDGNFLFGQTASGNYSDSFEEIDIDSKGNIYVTGYFYGDLDFVDTLIYNPYNNISSAFGYGFIVKYDSTGNYVWVRAIGGDSTNIYPQGLNIDKYDNIYISATFSDTVQLDAFQIYSNPESMFSASFNPMGDTRWVLKTEPLGPAGVPDQCSSMDKDGNMYVGGIFYDSVKFGGTNIYFDAEPYNAYISKIIPPLSSEISASATALCKGDSLYFSSLALGSPITYSWFFNGGNPSASNAANPTVHYDSSGTYNVKLVVSNPYESDSIILTNYIVVNNSSPQTFTLGNDTTVCSGFLLSAPPGFAQYLWSDNSTQPFITINNSGSFSVRIMDSNYCKAFDTVNIQSLPLPVLSLGNDTLVCGNTISLDAGSGFTSYQWSTGTTTQQVSVTTSGFVSVTVTGSNQCSNADTLFIDTCSDISQHEYLNSNIFISNPAVDYLTISFRKENINSSALFTIYDIYGHALIAGTHLTYPSISIPVQSLSCGIYFISIKLTDYSAQVRKFIKIN